MRFGVGVVGELFGVLPRGVRCLLIPREPLGGVIISWSGSLLFSEDVIDSVLDSDVVEDDEEDEEDEDDDDELDDGVLCL